ncbi:serine hydrolase domain-containing protein [Maribacter sp. 2307UL18-2]|uniref:serine hydrolase domain-containing protein n=1 Tax=Maribacter sp. 2307UL18-2 TaxID=3386274 RepID=UPI0039BC3B31
MKNQILIIAFAFLIISCKNSNDNKAETSSTNLKELEVKIDSLFNSKIGINEPGAAVLISYDQKMIIGKGYGLRDLETKTPITINTNMRMGSVSKQFTALCVLSLVDDGLFSLNDSITKFWDYPVFKDITVKQLINHTSGIADYYDNFDKNWDKNRIVVNQDILEWLATHPRPIFKPGTKWKYSNTGYIVLALLAEKVSGEEFASYAKKNVFDKANMQETNYYSLANPIEIKERAFCYEKDSLNMWVKADGNYMNGMLGDGAVYTSIKDFHAYNNALQEQSIVSKKMHELVFRPSSMAINDTYGLNFLNNAEEKYGAGWFLTKDFALHSGSWIGARTIVIKELDRPLTIAIFLNSSSSDTRKILIEETYKFADEYIKTAANNGYK